MHCQSEAQLPTRLTITKSGHFCCLVSADDSKLTTDMLNIILSQGAQVDPAVLPSYHALVGINVSYSDQEEGAYLLKINSSDDYLTTNLNITQWLENIYA